MAIRAEAGSRRPVKRWAGSLHRSLDRLTPLELTGAVADRVAAAIGLDPVAEPDRDRAELDGLLASIVDPPTGWADPWLVGAVHEQATSAADRKARGAWYTPRPVVEGLVRLATADGAVPDVIIDPTCGGGAFLLAGLDRLVALGVEPLGALSRIGGTDIDAEAVAVSRWSVTLWLGHQLGGDHRAMATFDPATIDLRCGDAMDPGDDRWPAARLVVGNPPFASPLKRGVVPDGAARFRAERSELLGPYADIAAAHLLRAVEGAGAGSTVVLVQPQSVLSSRDTEGLRRHLDELAPLKALWAARQPVFDAGVRACAPVLVVGGVAGPVRLADGADVRPLGIRQPQSWGDHAADALGAPTLPSSRAEVVGDGGRRARPDRRLGELVTATAGFRDEHYGLVSVCREAEPGEGGGNGVDTARLVTVGSVDPLTVAWGRSPFRFGGRDWSRPIVERAGLSPKVGGWFDRQLSPKVLLATQTKLLEPVVDRAGDLMPATPLIGIKAGPEELDRVAAVLLAPPVVVWAWRRWFGTALTVDAVKLAARQVGELPLPRHAEAWAEAAAVVASADDADPATAWDASQLVAEIMTEAYGASDEVLQWWRARRKDRPTTD